jgi:phenylacetate-coenzyme A ligase PaaK-like adenylate-forming protein
MQNLENKIFNSTLDSHFEEVALEVFHYQYEQVPIYQAFCNFLKRSPKQVSTLDQIPFLPIQFFKQEKIQAKTCTKSDAVFTSSGTTGWATSKHHVAKLAVYETAFLQNFTQFYGPVEDYVILGLLPSYLEREGSSLIYMVNKMIEISRVRHPESGFFLNEHEQLANLLYSLDGKKKIILIGVSFGLLDFIEKYQFNLTTTVVMETGGMKGRRKEMIRDELHSTLKSGFGVSKIHSEYGMTEMLSQAYSLGDGLFTTPNLMKVYIRNTEDPLEILSNNKNGGINIVDLSNLYSISFIATQDLGKRINSTDFEVVGRFDHSDVRGCNLLLL